MKTFPFSSCINSNHLFPQTRMTVFPECRETLLVYFVVGDRWGGGRERDLEGRKTNMELLVTKFALRLEITRDGH